MSVMSARDEFAMQATVPFSPVAVADYEAPAGRRGLWAWLRGVAQWAAEQPRRRALITELAALSDHELADVGLVRGELHRVFDRDFTQRRAG